MLYIHEIGVLPEYQRQGIGFQIPVNIKGLCKLRGIYKFFLLIQKNNIASCALYEKAGGERINNGQHDVIYFFNN